MKSFDQLIRDEEWHTLIIMFKPIEVAKRLSFKKGMLLSRDILMHDFRDDALQVYAIELMEAIKDLYADEWKTDWRYDACLGNTYKFRGFDYEKEFDSYLQAYKKSDPPDPEVMICLAQTWSFPGVQGEKLDEHQAIALLEKALEILPPYVEPASSLAVLYEKIGDTEKKKYWDAVFEDSTKKDLNMPSKYLSFLDEWREEEKNQ